MSCLRQGRLVFIRVLMVMWRGRKDDYAFFISPVDPSRVQGYAEMIKHPMDLGTMSTKVAKGKYRSLEEFTVSETPFIC